MIGMTKDDSAGQAGSSTPIALKVLTGVRGTICAAHEGPDGSLHGHTWSVTAWWNDSRCAIEAKQTLDSYISFFDHSRLAPSMSRGEAIAKRVLQDLGCAAVDVDRPLEGIFARAERPS